MNRGLDCWQNIPKNGRKFSTKQRAGAWSYKELDYDRYNLAFLWLFGLVDVEQGERLPKKTWCPAAVRHTAFGDALLTRLGNANLPMYAEDEFFAPIFNPVNAVDDRTALVRAETNRPDPRFRSTNWSRSSAPASRNGSGR